MLPIPSALQCPHRTVRASDPGPACYAAARRFARRELGVDLGCSRSMSSLCRIAPCSSCRSFASHSPATTCMRVARIKGQTARKNPLEQRPSRPPGHRCQRLKRPTRDRLERHMSQTQPVRNSVAQPELAATTTVAAARPRWDALALEPALKRENAATKAAILMDVGRTLTARRYAKSWGFATEMRRWAALPGPTRIARRLMPAAITALVPSSKGFASPSNENTARAAMAVNSMAIARPPPACVVRSTPGTARDAPAVSSVGARIPQRTSRVWRPKNRIARCPAPIEAPANYSGRATSGERIASTRSAWASVWSPRTRTAKTPWSARKMANARSEWCTATCIRARSRSPRPTVAGRRQKRPRTNMHRTAWMPTELVPGLAPLRRSMGRPNVQQLLIFGAHT